VRGFCMKCRCEQEILKPKTVLMKNGRSATMGVCARCGTRMYRLGKPS